MTWRWVNNQRIFIFGCAMPLTSSPRAPFTSNPCCVFISRWSSSDIPVLELISAAYDTRAAVDLVSSLVLSALASVKCRWVRSETVRSTPKEWYLGWGCSLNLSRFRHYYSVMVWSTLPPGVVLFLFFLFIYFFFWSSQRRHNELSCRCECLSWIWNWATGIQREAWIEPSCFLPQSLNPIAFPEQETPLRFAECRIPAANAALTSAKSHHT